MGGLHVDQGAAADWYPYPFLDPANGGYGRVAVYCIAIFVFVSAVCIAVAWIGNAARHDPAKGVAT